MFWVTSPKDKCICPEKGCSGPSGQYGEVGGSKDPEMGWTPLERALVTNME